MADRTAASPPCPAENPAARAAADAALRLMTVADPKIEHDVLSPSLYQLSSSGRGIEFDSTVAGVGNEAKALLIVAQKDDSVAEFLREGQIRCETASRGFYPRLSSKALAIAASTAIPWCGGSLKIGSTLASAREANPFVTLGAPSVSKFTPSAADKECSPFFGPDQNTHFLLATLSDTKKGDRVEYTLAMDPIPYTQPGAYYEPIFTPPVLCGSLAKPFTLVVTSLYAVPDHQNEWAQRNVSGQCQIGQFSQQVQVLGTTLYEFIQNTSQDCSATPCGNPS